MGAEGLSRCQALMKNCRNFWAYWVGETLVWERKIWRLYKEAATKISVCTTTLKCSLVQLENVIIQKLRYNYEIISQHWPLSQGEWGKITLFLDYWTMTFIRYIQDNASYSHCYFWLISVWTHSIEKENIYLKTNTLEALIFLSCLIMN